MGVADLEKAMMRGSLSAGTAEQRPPVGRGGVNHVKVWGKNILGRENCTHKGGNEFGVFVGL